MNTHNTQSGIQTQSNTAPFAQARFTKPDVYQTITDKIIAALEAGTAPWVKPWASIGAPRNAVTGREYSGINNILLSMTNYSSNQWLTYKQATEAGGQVRKGEQGTAIILFKPLRIEDKNATPDTGTGKIIPLMRTFTVFNTQQIDGLPAKYTEERKLLIDEFTDNATAEAMLAQATIHHGHSRACFIPSLDVIHMPNRSEFKSIPDYYSTGLHELTHWTGHSRRLHRDFNGRFGDQSYAFEELVAELGSSFLCATAGIDGKLQHASYIASWLKVLRNDKKAIFTAAAAARKAAEFVIPTGSMADQDEQEAA